MASIEDLINSEPGAGAGAEPGAEPGAKISFNIFDKLKAPRVNKSLSEYTNSPFNKNGDENTSLQLRGIEGLFGSFDYAIVDLIMGTINKLTLKAKAKVEKNA